MKDESNIYDIFGTRCSYIYLSHTTSSQLLYLKLALSMHNGGRGTFLFSGMLYLVPDVVCRNKITNT